MHGHGHDHGHHAEEANVVFAAACEPGCDDPDHHHDHPWHDDQCPLCRTVSTPETTVLVTFGVTQVPFNSQLHTAVDDLFVPQCNYGTVPIRGPPLSA